MILSEQEARQIVRRVKESIGRDINIMDETGTILASTNPKRTGQVHEGAKKLLDEHLEVLEINGASPLRGVQEGVNLPISFHGRTIGVIGITGKPEEVSMFGRVIRQMTEVLVESTWRQEQENQLESARELFWENWLFSDDPEEGELEVRARLLGIDPAVPRTVILLEMTPRPGENREEELRSSRILALVRQNLMDNAQNFCTAVRRRILILCCGPAAAVRDLLRRLSGEIESFYPVRVSGGVSTQTSDCRDLRRCYVEARTACRTAVLSESRRFIFYDDVSLETVVQSIPQSVCQQLFEKVFAACTPEETAEFLDTLRRWFSNGGNTERAARGACIHKNTFLYRMGRIQERTGYSLRNPEQSALLYLALQSAERIQNS